MTEIELNKILKEHALWLKDNSKGCRADLRGANLSYSDLSGANLSVADLSGADLNGAYLRGADLRGANLRGADLSDADLSGADLRGAYLSGADLNGADLNGADLRGAYLSGANLRRANLRGADLRRANLDFSCLPLWCGSLKAKFDIKHYNQFMYHILKSLENNNLIDEKTKKQFLTKNNIELANQFHRVEECGKVGESDE